MLPLTLNPKWETLPPDFRPPPLKWNNAFIAYSSIIEGSTEKVLQFIMPLKSIYNRSFGFIEQKNYFLNTTESFSKTNSINCHHFCAMEKNYVNLFRAAPYMLMLVLCKDALFHYKLQEKLRQYWGTLSNISKARPVLIRYG
jgi:hypothetical protein